MMQTPEYKVVVIGNTQMGKTTFVRRLFYDVPNLFIINKTLGVDVKPIDINGNNGKIRINFWDCGGEVQGLKDGYYRGCQGAIIFRKTGSEDHLEFETLLKPDVKKFYIDDYDVTHIEDSLEGCKSELYNWIYTTQNISNYSYL